MLNDMKQTGEPPSMDDLDFDVSASTGFNTISEV